MNKIALNLPLLLALVITVGFSADLPFLGALKSEATFGWWVVVLVPASVLLVITQVVLWVVLPRSRPLRRSVGSSSTA